MGSKALFVFLLFSPVVCDSSLVFSCVLFGGLCGLLSAVFSVVRVLEFGFVGVPFGLLKFGFGSALFGLWGLKFWLADVPFGLWGLKIWVGSVPFGLWGLKIWVGSVPFGLWGLEFWFGGVPFGLRGLKFWFGDVPFGLRGLEFWYGCVLFEPCVVLLGPGGVAVCLWVGLNSLLLGFSCIPCSCSLLYSCSFVKFTGLMSPMTPVNCCWSPDHACCDSGPFCWFGSKFGGVYGGVYQFPLLPTWFTGCWLYALE